MKVDMNSVCFRVHGCFPCFPWNIYRDSRPMHKIPGELPESLWKFCYSTKFAHQKLKWNYDIYAVNVYVFLMMFWKILQLYFSVLKSHIESQNQNLRKSFLTHRCWFSGLETAKFGLVGNPFHLRALCYIC